MPRPSNRNAILIAAVRVAESQGLTGVTLESVAAASGMTRAGLAYHFPTRTTLIGAIHRFLAEQWEAEMLQDLGTSLETASPAARAAAYVRGTIRIAGRANLMYLNESDGNPAYDTPWKEVLERWIPAPHAIPEEGPYPEELVRTLIATMAATGLWMYESMMGVQLPDGLRTTLSEKIVAGIPEPDERV